MQKQHILFSYQFLARTFEKEDEHEISGPGKLPDSLFTQ